MLSLLLRLKRAIKRRLRVESDSRQKEAPTRRDYWLKLALLVLISLVVALVYPGEHLRGPLDTPHAGDLATDDLIAPFRITVAKSPVELAEEQELATAAIPQILVYDSSVVQAAFASLDAFTSLIDSLRRVDARSGPGGLENVIDLVTARFPFMGSLAIERSLTQPDDPQIVRDRLVTLLRDDIYAIGVINDLSNLPEGRVRMVLLRRGDKESIYQRDRILDMPRANARLLTALNQQTGRMPLDVEYYYLIGRTFVQPNLRLDVAEYQQRVTEGLAQISTVKEVVNEGDTIVRAGRRISEREAMVIRELVRVQRQQTGAVGLGYGWWPALARFLLVASIFGVLYLALYYFRRPLFRSTTRLLALMLVFALQIGTLFVLRAFDIGDTSLLLPVAILPIMVTVLFDAEVGMLCTVVLALLLGVLHRFDFSLVLMTSLIGTVACFASRHVRRRSHFYRIVLLVSLAYVAYIVVVESLKLAPTTDIFEQALYGFVVALLSTLLTIGLLPFFESIFSITTDITLLELSDLNHPLLKRLALEAPGTHHHSISVGTLSEAAAKAIDANPLLARVGCYYHDIGKIEIPEYFVENQLGVASKHAALSPSMSSLILTAHVKRGRRLGEEFDIPDDVLNFIEEHHGTMVMSYFYQKALEQGADPSVKDKFRYPGPKPQIRETGIAMLADAVEAASRTLEDPSPARIHNLIQRIISDRFQSGELDECPLTLRDLARIREAFAQVLIGAFHHRVAYPKRDHQEV